MLIILKNYHPNENPMISKIERIDYIEHSRFLSIIRRSRVDLAGLILDQILEETSGTTWHANAACEIFDDRVSDSGSLVTRKPYNTPDPHKYNGFISRMWRKRNYESLLILYQVWKNLLDNAYLLLFSNSIKEHSTMIFQNLHVRFFFFFCKIYDWLLNIRIE